MSDNPSGEMARTGKGVLDDFFRRIADLHGLSPDMAQLLQQLHAGDSLSTETILEGLKKLRDTKHEDETE